MVQSWKLGIASCLVVGSVITPSRFANAFYANCAYAQVIPDNTLGNENSTVKSTGSVDSINGGATRGANLFHSFGEFNVGEGRSVYFTNPAGIENILTRVTGANPSNILGTLGVSGGNANLFLINPNGIIFGKNARLDVRGSFVTSTASSLNFADGKQFSATAPQTVPLLSVNVPLGLQFGEGAGRIVNQSVVDNSSGIPVGLQVDPGKTLALVGGDVALEGGNLTAEAGRIELGSVADSSLVSLTPTAQGFALGYQGVQNFRDVQLSQEAYVEASGEGGGNVQVQGKRVTLTDGSGIVAFTTRSRSAGTLTVNASDSVELIGSADPQNVSRLNTDTFGSGSAGDLRITTRKLILQGGAYVSSNTSNVGNGGNLQIYAAESVNISGVDTIGFSSGLFASTRAEGQGGSITIDTGNLQIADGAVVSAKTISTGNAGYITINANTVEAVRGGQIQVATQGSGKAGNISVNIPNSITLTGSDPTFFERTKQLAQLDLNVNNVSPDSGLFANTTKGSIGNGGDVVLNTGQLNVSNGAEVSVSNQGIGNAGNIQAKAFEILLDNQGKLTAESVSGKGGNIQLQTENLLLRKNSLVSAISGVTGDNGVDGNINIDTKFLLAVPSENSDIAAIGFGRSPGSNVRVNAQVIFGTQFRQQQTLESDIDATGQVTINTPNTNPGRGLVSLPVVPFNSQIAQTCTPGSSQSKSEFVVTGRGGLPPSPDEMLSGDAIQVDWVTLNPKVESRNQGVSTNITTPEPNSIVEATGWTIAHNGDVILTASATPALPANSWQTPAKCQAK